MQQNTCCWGGTHISRQVAVHRCLQQEKLRIYKGTLVNTAVNLLSFFATKLTEFRLHRLKVDPKSNTPLAGCFPPQPEMNREFIIFCRLQSCYPSSHRFPDRSVLWLMLQSSMVNSHNVAMKWRRKLIIPSQYFLTILVD